jgi:hypothetical protein
MGIELSLGEFVSGEVVLRLVKLPDPAGIFPRRCADVDAIFGKGLELCMESGGEVSHVRKICCLRKYLLESFWGGGGLRKSGEASEVKNFLLC